MKYALLLLLIGLAAVFAQDELAADVPDSEDEVLDIDAALMCLGHGRALNGRKTCALGCRLACQQPGCDGFKRCVQIPNPGEAPPAGAANSPTPYLHKYRCECNSS